MPDLTPKNGKIPDWVTTFLEGLRATGNVRAACIRAGVTRQNAYLRKASHPGFAKQWQEALDDAIDVLEAVAWGRAQKKSDVLLIFLLKAHRPDMYRETFNVNFDPELRDRVCESVAKLAAGMVALTGSADAAISPAGGRSGTGGTSKSAAGDNSEAVPE